MAIFMSSTITALLYVDDATDRMVSHTVKSTLSMLQNASAAADAGGLCFRGP